MIDFTGAMNVVIPEGNVVKIADKIGNILWQKPSESGGDGVNYITAIQTDGACSIDTGFYPNQDTRIVMDIAIMSNSAVTTGIFGGRSGTNKEARAMWFMSEGKVRSDYANSTYNMTAPGFGERFTIDANKNTTTISGVSYSHTAATFQSTGPLMLFDINTGGSPNKRRPRVICWGSQVYDNATLVHDYRPAIDPDGVVCLYDEVDGEYLYTLEGSLTAVVEDVVIITTSVSDTGGAADRLVAELGTLTVGETQITAVEQTVMLEGGTNSVVVTYTLGSSLLYARSISVCGVDVGTVQAAGSSVSATINVADGETIDIVFTQES